MTCWKLAVDHHGGMRRWGADLLLPRRRLLPCDDGDRGRSAVLKSLLGAFGVDLAQHLNDGRHECRVDE
jgi:hypothetical protein